MLRILRKRFPPVTAPAGPAKPAPAPPATWPSRPLPPSAEGRFRVALRALQQKIAASNDPRAARYRCWLAKLEAGADDRVIQWHSICPRTSGAIGAAWVVGPCDITAGGAVNQAQLQAAIKSVGDVERANEQLTFMNHMRSEILFNHEMLSEKFHLETFRQFHDEVNRTIEKLDEWANAPMGGSSAMPSAYRAIAGWIGRQQGKANSVYSCL
jgi:hypothetical protein